MNPSLDTGKTRSISRTILSSRFLIRLGLPLVGISTIDGSLPPLPLLSRRVLPLGDLASACGWAGRLSSR